jgi:hypothetical protein
MDEDTGNLDTSVTTTTISNNNGINPSTVSLM